MSSIETIEIMGTKIGVSFIARYRNVNTYGIHLPSHQGHTRDVGGPLRVEICDDGSLYRADEGVTFSDARRAIANFEHKKWVAVQEWAKNGGYDISEMKEHPICLADWI